MPNILDCPKLTELLNRTPANCRQLRISDSHELSIVGWSAQLQSGRDKNSSPVRASVNTISLQLLWMTMIQWLTVFLSMQSCDLVPLCAEVLEEAVARFVQSPMETGMLSSSDGICRWQNRSCPTRNFWSLQIVGGRNRLSIQIWLASYCWFIPIKSKHVVFFSNYLPFFL